MKAVLKRLPVIGPDDTSVSIDLLDPGTGKIVRQDLFCREPLLCHNGGPYLAEADTVAPSGTVEYEAVRPAVRRKVFRHNESAAVKVRRRQPPADLELFPDDDALLRTGYLEAFYPSGRPPFEWCKVLKRAEINPRFLPDDLFQLASRVFHLPAKKMRRFPVKAGEYLCEQLFILRVAVYIRQALYPFGRLLLGNDRGKSIP